MRVLLLHSRYLSGSTSGENRVVADEANLLRSGGHEVTVWAPGPEDLSGVALVRAGIGTVWSQAAAEKTRELLDHVDPDVVHCHNLFPMLSPSVLRTVGGRTALVMTLHNYRLLCLPGTLLRDGRACELCVGRVPWRGVRYRCHRESTLQSGALAASLVLHRALRSFDRVDVSLCVSRFVLEKYVGAGLARERARIKPNFAWETVRRQGPGDYFLFVGRVSQEKGVGALLDLDWESIGRLLVAGDGPEAGQLRRKAGRAVEFLGRVSPDRVSRLIAGARAVLVPSVWHEPAPRVVLEAFAAGVPVIASRKGGLPETVEDGVSGLLAAPADQPGWMRALRTLADDDESQRLGEGAWKAWQRRHSPAKALENLEEAYDHAMARRRS